MTLRHEDTLDLLDGQASVLQRIADGDSLDETLCSVALLLEQLMPGSCCTVLLLNPESRTLHHGAAPSLPDTYSSAIEGMSIGPVAGSCGTAAYLQEPVIVGDIVNDPRWADFQQLAADHGLRSCWSTPIWSRSQVVGRFAVYHFDPHLPTGRESELVSRVSHLASLAINHADGERERRARLEADAAREAADAASRTKSAFTANLSQRAAHTVAGHHRVHGVVEHAELVGGPSSGRIAPHGAGDVASADDRRGCARYFACRGQHAQA